MHISTSRDISQVDKKNHIGMIFIFFCNDRKIHGSFYVDIMLEKGSMDLPVLTETQLEYKNLKLSWFVWTPRNSRMQLSGNVTTVSARFSKYFQDKNNDRLFPFLLSESPLPASIPISCHVMCKRNCHVL